MKWIWKNKTTPFIPSKLRLPGFVTLAGVMVLATITYASLAKTYNLEINEAEKSAAVSSATPFQKKFAKLERLQKLSAKFTEDGELDEASRVEDQIRYLTYDLEKDFPRFFLNMDFVMIKMPYWDLLTKYNDFSSSMKWVKDGSKNVYTVDDIKALSEKYNEVFVAIGQDYLEVKEHLEKFKEDMLYYLASSKASGLAEGRRAKFQEHADRMVKPLERLPDNERRDKDELREKFHRSMKYLYYMSSSDIIISYSDDLQKVFTDAYVKAEAPNPGFFTQFKQMIKKAQDAQTALQEELESVRDYHTWESFYHGLIVEHQKTFDEFVKHRFENLARRYLQNVKTPSRSDIWGGSVALRKQYPKGITTKHTAIEAKFALNELDSRIIGFVVLMKKQATLLADIASEMGIDDVEELRKVFMEDYVNKLQNDLQGIYYVFTKDALKDPDNPIHQQKEMLDTIQHLLRDVHDGRAFDDIFKESS
jgi:hypothetical protein